MIGFGRVCRYAREAGVAASAVRNRSLIANAYAIADVSHLGSIFIYNFKEEQNKQSYVAEAQWKEIILFSAILTIFISCIGLFGLSVLFAEKRTKEIGIRKLLGASVSSIVAILSTGFIKLIFIALAISMPFAWMATSKWLQEYPYRITLSWWLFASAGILVIAVALITTSFQSIKAAMANPVKNLRGE